MYDCAQRGSRDPRRSSYPPTMTPDQERLRRCVDEKSDAAFAELVQRYVDLVYSAALRQVRGDAHRAQDVAQVVFTTLTRKAAALTSHPVLTGWLYTTTHFAAEKTMRAEWRRLAREREAQAMQEISAGASESTVDWERIRPVLDAAMRELGERDREAVLLRFFAGRPFAEIGTTLHLSEDAARMRVRRSLDQLHALLARRG
jgi:RNA polymerase sigma factor (sigma-70 family)